jgi:apolipoprotein N-acyltransferase
VPLSAQPLRFENKYRWLRPDGTIDHTYFKHHPAPGEPALVGTGRLPIVNSELGRLGGALCYDYDFPALASEHGAAGVDLVALPSSDWRGIDPIHTQMAALRAIEQGVSIVRSTRFGLSAGIDPFGRLRARQSSFDARSRVLLLALPEHGIATFYRSWGDLLVYACFAWLLFALARIALATQHQLRSRQLKRLTDQRRGERDVAAI